MWNFTFRILLGDGVEAAFSRAGDGGSEKARALCTVTQLETQADLALQPV